MNHPEEFTKTSSNCITKWVLKERQQATRKKGKGNEIVDLFCILIDWIPQSTVVLYIYRVDGLAPQEILLQDLNL